jgi:uncharacterized protein YciI
METKQLFAVIRARGPGWAPGLPLEKQDDWRGHAAFMDALEAEGFVRFAGPLAGTQDALLVVRATSEDEVRGRLAGDPWNRLAILRTTQVARWDLRIGSIP